MRTTHTPGRHIRVPDELWQQAQQQADEDGTTVSAIVVKALERYTRKQRARAQATS